MQKPLSDDQFKDVVADWGCATTVESFGLRGLCRFIEQAHGIYPEQIKEHSEGDPVQLELNMWL